METKIVVLGGGYAGVLTAKKLEKRFRHGKEVKITLIKKTNYHIMLTELHEVAARRVEEDSIRVSLRRVFSGRRVRVVTDTIFSVDYENKILRGAAGDYAYDFLVLATGSQSAFFASKAEKNTP
jgi:NADH dehydrogenase